MALILTYNDALRLGIVVGANAVITSLAVEPNSTTNAAVTQEVSPNPVVSLLGKYRDEPLWDGFEEALQIIRDEESQSGR